MRCGTTLAEDEVVFFLNLSQRYGMWAHQRSKRGEKHFISGCCRKGQGCPISDLRITIKPAFSADISFLVSRSPILKVFYPEAARHSWLCGIPLTLNVCWLHDEPNLLTGMILERCKMVIDQFKSGKDACFQLLFPCGPISCKSSVPEVLDNPAELKSTRLTRALRSWNPHLAGRQLSPSRNISHRIRAQCPGTTFLRASFHTFKTTIKRTSAMMKFLALNASLYLWYRATKIWKMKTMTNGKKSKFMLLFKGSRKGKPDNLVLHRECKLQVLVWWEAVDNCDQCFLRSYNISVTNFGTLKEADRKESYPRTLLERSCVQRYSGDSEYQEKENIYQMNWALMFENECEGWANDVPENVLVSINMQDEISGRCNPEKPIVSWDSCRLHSINSSFPGVGESVW